MREANKAIKKTNLPIPRAEDISSQLSGYKVFSKLDFKSAFHQLEIEEESRALTVFHAGDRLMRYKRLTMGSAPASGELNKALKPLFKDIPHVHVIHDDLIVAGRTQAEHDETLNKVCRRILESGMTLNPEKCIIADVQIPWWGMVISETGISPDPQKVEAIKHMTEPKSKAELKSFLCMVQSNMKSFVPSLAKKTKHLRRLIKDNVKFVWNRECQKEFETLRDDFSEDILIHHYNPQEETQLVVDASQSGLSALLVQGTQNDKKIVAVASRATSSTEARYPQLDLEALAIDFGLRRFRYYIAGGPKVTVITDHKPLESIFKNIRSGSIRTERIKLRHQDLDYKVKWEKGDSNAADYLSRHATPLKHIPKDQREESLELEKTIWFVQYNPYIEAISVEKLIDATCNDAVLQRLIKCIRKGYLPKKHKDLTQYAKIFSQLAISDSGLVLKGEKIVLPNSLLETALKKAHQGSHPGITSMKRRLRGHFYIPELNKHVESMVKNCKHCAMYTSKYRKNKLHPHNLEEYNAWEKVSVDLFGPMPNKRHIVVAQDMVSKFPAAKIVSKTDADHVIGALEEMYANYGAPLVHRTDNGPPFNSMQFAKFSDDKGIHHEKSFPYHPQANPVECLMKPLGKSMKIAHYDSGNLDTALQNFLTTYRATPNKTTGIAPGDVMFRHGYGNNFPKTFTPDNDTVREALSMEQQYRECKGDEMNINRRREEFHIGDQVLTRNEKKKTKFEPTFDPTPRTITHVENGGIVCRDEEGVPQRRHMDDIKMAPICDTPGSEVLQDESQVEIPVINRQDPIGSNQAVQPRKSMRERKPNPKYDDYQLY